MKNFTYLFLIFVITPIVITTSGLEKSGTLRRLRKISQKAELEPCIPIGASEVIVGLLDKLKETIQTGSPSLGPLDPLQLPYVPLEMNNELINGTLKLDNFIFSGLSGFTIPRSNLSVRSTTEGIVFDLDLGLILNLQLNTDYEGELRLFQLLDLFGKGNIIFNLLQLVIDAQIKLRLSLLPYQIELMQGTELKLQLPVVESRITGLLDDNYMSDVISRQLAATLTLMFYQEQAAFNAAIQAIIDRIIGSINQQIDPLAGAPFKRDYNAVVMEAVEMAFSEVEKKIPQLVNVLKMEML